MEPPIMVRAASRIRAFTLVEVMVVISILAILISMVLYVSGGVSGTEQLLRSQNHLREINQWMQNYSSSHDSRVLPSQFDRLDEDGENVGGVASRFAYDLLGSGDDAEAHWRRWPFATRLLGDGADRVTLLADRLKLRRGDVTEETEIAEADWNDALWEWFRMRPPV